MSHTSRRPSLRRCSVRSFLCRSSSWRESLAPALVLGSAGRGVVLAMGGMTIESGRRKLWMTMWMNAGATYVLRNASSRTRSLPIRVTCAGRRARPMVAR